MANEKTFKGLVVRELATGEQDKLISVIAEGQGKITISCKGVRSIKSHRLASTQLFCYDEFTVSERGGRMYLKEAQLISNFYALRENIESLALAQYVCDAVCEVSLEGDAEDDDILNLALNTLYIISTGSKPKELIKAAFELRLCSVTGFAPLLDLCSVCGEEKEGYTFDINGGVLICDDCWLDAENTVISGARLTPAVLSAMRYIITAPPKRLFSFYIDESLYPELSDISERYFLSKIERSFDTLKFYHSLGI